jgi:hypothetical protein
MQSFTSDGDQQEQQFRHFYLIAFLRFSSTVFSPSLDRISATFVFLITSLGNPKKKTASPSAVVLLHLMLNYSG